MATEGSEFIVKLNGMKLSPADEARIAAEVRMTVMRELAKVDPKGDLHVRIPYKEWLGIWLERVGKGEIPMLKVIMEGP